MAEQHVKDMVTFGTNMIELSPNVIEDDAPLIIKYSLLLDSLNLNVSMYFSLALFMTDAGYVATEAFFRNMTRINTIFVPSGDGGPDLPPEQFFSLTQNLTALLKRYHPQAEMWISTQMLSMDKLDYFYAYLNTSEARSYITGIIYGPHNPESLTVATQRLPLGYPVRLYPDLCHTIYAQFSLPSWSTPWPFTHKRQVINPSPLFETKMAMIFTNTTFATRMVGFGGYSEGLNDDLNKCIWSGLYADANSNVFDIVQEYAK